MARLTARTAQPKLTLLSLVWNYLKTYVGLIQLWTLGLTLSTVLGVNALVLNLPESRAAMLGITVWALSGLFFKQAINGSLALLGLITIGLAWLGLIWANLWLPVYRVFNAALWVLRYQLTGADIMPALHSLQTALGQAHLAWLHVITRLEQGLPAVGQVNEATPFVLQLVWGMALWLAISFLDGWFGSTNGLSPP